MERRNSSPPPLNGVTFPLSSSGKLSPPLLLVCVLPLDATQRCLARLTFTGPLRSACHPRSSVAVETLQKGLRTFPPGLQSPAATRKKSNAASGTAQQPLAHQAPDRDESQTPVSGRILLWASTSRLEVDEVGILSFVSEGKSFPDSTSSFLLFPLMFLQGQLLLSQTESVCAECRWRYLLPLSVNSVPISPSPLLSPCIITSYRFS